MLMSNELGRASLQLFAVNLIQSLYTCNNSKTTPHSLVVYRLRLSFRVNQITSCSVNYVGLKHSCALTILHGCTLQAWSNEALKLVQATSSYSSDLNDNNASEQVQECEQE